MRQNSAAATDDVTGERLPDQARTLAERLFETRNLSLTLAAPLSPEDMVVQAMDDASPTKWHLAHVTWFFETFVLKPHLEGYRLFDDTFNYCFNSYYESLGPRQPRPKRGLLTRPSAERVLAYRAHVDGGLEKLLSRDEGSSARSCAPDRDRHQPRAAASGTAADRYSGAVCRKSAAAGIPGGAVRAGRFRCRPRPLDQLCGRHLPCRSLDGRLLLGQRAAVA